MPNTYTGNPNGAAPGASITLPSPGDPRNAASVDAPIEALADQVAYIGAHLTNLSQTFASSGTWTCPTGVTTVLLVGCGGGGGGGAGYAGDNFSAHWGMGGGGGGSSRLKSQVVTVVPGTVYTIAIGAGGGGGTGAGAGLGAGTDGSAGGDTTFSNPTPTVLATFAGASGGKAGQLMSTTSDFGIASGGFPTKGGTQLSGTFVDSVILASGDGAGGDGTINTMTARAGWYSDQGNAGGAAGTQGTDSTTVRGGGSGGGGGGGPGGAGGAAGNGGNAAPIGSGTATGGTAGSGGVGAGAGGGGGGAGGCGGTGGGSTGGNGGAGHAGQLTIFWTGL